MKSSLKRILLIGVIAPILGAVALCAIASIWPLRLDARALQDLDAVQRLGLPASSGNFVFLSRDNSIESARAATFALRQLAFPDGSVFWAALKEHCDGVWSGGFVAVDSAGSAFTISGWSERNVQWGPVKQGADEVHPLIAQGFVVYDSPSTREAFEQRWPFLKASERVALLTDAAQSSSFRLRRPASEFTFKRLWRISAVLGSYAAVLLVLMQLPSSERPDVRLVSAGAVFVALGLNFSLTYLLQWIAPALVHWSALLLWSLLLSLAVVQSRAGSGAGGIDQRLSLPMYRAARFALIYGLVAYALLFLVRLDFDGDFFNNWLPQGRFHYLLGRHDPSAIMGQSLIHAGSYPPGYGIVLSTLMWASGMSPAESFLFGPDSSLAILFYRLFILSLNAALLLVLATHLKDVGNREIGVVFGTVALTLVLLPTTAGQHIAAETVLFPMMAGAIVLIAAGRRLGAPGLTAMGLAVGGMGTLIKWEATLLFMFAVLPWLVSDALPSISRATRAVKLKWAATLALSLLPVLVWKLTLKVQNEFFVPMTWPRFVSSVHLLPGLTVRAVRLMLDDGRLVVLLALPGATLFRFWKSPRWTTLVVPVGIGCLFAGLVGIYLFTSYYDANVHLYTSYSRLVMIPTFGAILYCAEAVQLSRSSGTEAAAAQRPAVQSSC